jgi:NAD(P)-dependent dehydrogenase (short-subunit alcohol dehydrogenase family)
MIAVFGDRPVARAVETALGERGCDAVRFSERDFAPRDQSVEDILPSRLDGLFLGAPKEPAHARLADLSVAEFDEAIEVGLAARFKLLSVALPLLATAAGRVVIEVGSGAIAVPHGRCAEASTSAALVGLARAVALEYAREGVRVNVIVSAPRAEDWPAVASPIDIARLALTLLEPGAGGANGAIVACDGGLTAVVQLPPEIPDASV